MEQLGLHGVAALVLALGTLVLFSRDEIPLSYSCLVVLTILVLGFETFPYARDGEEFGAANLLAGFGNEALITILLLLILAKGIEVSGALGPLARALTRLWLFSSSLALLVTLSAAATLSAFMNNTPIVVMLLPVLIGVAHRLNAPPSKLLIPFGFASIVGGMCTTIGTSSNLLVISVAVDLGFPRLEMFDFVVPAGIGAVIAVLYLWAVAPSLLPVRRPPLARSTRRLFESVLTVADASPLAHKPFSELRQAVPENAQILGIQRGRVALVRLPSLILQGGDSVHIRGTPEAIKETQELLGGVFESERLHMSPNQVLTEIVVTHKSLLLGRKLSDVRGPVLSEVVPLGLFRPGREATQSLDESSDPTLELGDILLVQGDRAEIHRLQDRYRLLVLERNIHVPRSAKAHLAIAIMAGVVLVAAFGWLPILASALCGVGLMLLGRCLSLDEALTALDLQLILVIVTSLALGATLTFTGAAEFIAVQFVSLVGSLPPAVVLSTILLLTALLTEVVTNSAVAVISTPIAIIIARELGVPELPFVLAVLFGANMSYMTPIGYQTNLLVFTAGGYKFTDFLRVGVPLQIILWVALSVSLAALYL